MQIYQDEFNFPFRTGEPSAAAPITHVFPNAFDRVFVVMRGFRVGFKDGEDHHFGQVFVDLNCSADAPNRAATVTCILGLRDKSEDFDDSFGGQVQFTLIAEP